MADAANDSLAARDTRAFSFCLRKLLVSCEMITVSDCLLRIRSFAAQDRVCYIPCYIQGEMSFSPMSAGVCCCAAICCAQIHYGVRKWQG